jgi:single-stranded-DNA-specific exonuclease
MICGAAVAWKLVCAALNHPPAPSLESRGSQSHGSLPLTKGEVPKAEGVVTTPGWEKWLLDMVGIATISDMVPLVGENRVLATYGLRVLQKTPRLGLRRMFHATQLTPSQITEDDIAFTITPRINAASRMAHPMDAFNMLSATDPERADIAVAHLIQLNDERKKLVANIVKQAKAVLKKRDIGAVVVVGDPDWSTGVSGLVATKIAEDYQRPTFVWSKEGEVIKGSCRAWGDVSVVQLMEAVPEGTFLQFGGHAGAGGF